MRILTISSFYPPFVIGGAEICARNLSDWFTAQGHDVAVLTAAPSKADEAWGAEHDGYRVYRVGTHHLYPVAGSNEAPSWKKPLWHLQDLYDPRNEAVFERIIAEFKPDFAHVHWIQGMGYNGLKVLAKHDIPTAITLHDLALACVRTTMFRGTDECVGQCGTCRFSSKAKTGFLRQIPRLGFISPSQANMDTVAKYVPITDYPCFHILNPNSYPAPQVEHQPSDTVRLVFTGRLEDTKGINFILAVLEPLAERYSFTLDVMGKGPEEEALRQRYGHHDWLRIHGHVPLQQVADTMASGDLLLVPSLWAENSPGVVFQALGVGLPVIGSASGGLPEIIQPGVNGYLAPTGDADAWRTALIEILDNPAQLGTLRGNALASAREFDQDVLANRMLAAFEVIRQQ